MNDHRYILEKYNGISTRYHCPKCNHRDKTFVRYIDTETGEHINPSVGRCNREVNCGYHYTPKQYFNDNHISFAPLNTLKKYYKQATINPEIMIQKQQQKQVSFIPANLFIASLDQYEQNNFVKYLINLFNIDITNNLLKKYFIGTSKHWEGANIFWQIDIYGKV